MLIYTVAIISFTDIFTRKISNDKNLSPPLVHYLLTIKKHSLIPVTVPIGNFGQSELCLLTHIKTTLDFSHSEYTCPL